jgi:bifunctional DNase/RNase
MAENDQMVLIREVYVEADPNRGNMVILKERSEDDRFFLMFVGDSEFTAIAKEKGLVEPKRPLTHDLYLNILQQLRIEDVPCQRFFQVERVRVDRGQPPE